MIADNFPALLAFGFGGWELALIAGVFVLLFGSAKLPQLFRNMGRSVNEFKAGMNQEVDGLEDQSEDAKVEEKETADV